MPVKRKHGECEDDNALSYWLKNTTQLRQQSTRAGARNRSYKDALIQDAHLWGEAMVRAYLQNLTDAKETASTRRRRFDGGAQLWYARGYRFYLLPKSNGAPDAIADHVCLNEFVTHNRNSESNLRQVINEDSRKWMTYHADTIRAEVLAAEAAEARQESEKKRRAELTAGALQQQRMVQAKQSCSPALTTTSTTTTTTPATMVASKSTGHQLPSRLSRLIANPTTKEPYTPRAGIRELMVAAFRNERIARVWNDSESDNVRRLTFLDKRADRLGNELVERGLGAMCGLGGGTDDAKYLEAHKKAGLVLRGKGGFNGVWEANGNGSASWVAELLPPEVAAPFFCGRLVLRSPKPSAYALTLDEAIDEATNMLFTALASCGPRVAAIGFSHWQVMERGKLKDEYKIYAFIETATTSVDQRYKSTAPRSSPVNNRPYHDALLVAIYRMSIEGYVHLDATLRNFVDFYPKALPGDLGHFGVKIIDVEGRHFRRLIKTETTEWRYLFLFNLLVVQVFLKIRLGEAWQPEVHWSHLRAMCEQLISELPGARNLPAITMWEGDFFVESDFFPELSEGEFAGDSHEAVMRSATWQLKHYLLKQPYDEGMNNYVSIIRPDKKNPNRVRTHQELRVAREWFENTYCKQLLPSRTFFDERMHDRVPKRFVEVAFEFLDTSLSDLQRASAKLVTPIKDHHASCSAKFLLGIA